MLKIISLKEAKEKALAITKDGMHFRGQFLWKESYCLFDKEVEVLDKAFNFVYWIKYNNVEYFISEDLIKKL